MVNPNQKNTKAFNQGKEGTNHNRSRFHMPQETKTTLTMGQITPILCVETLPNDDWTIQAEIFTRWAPLILPIMHRIDMQCNYFYVPNRILWPEPNGWESFITMKVPDMEPPFIQINTTSANLVNSTLCYLGVPYSEAVGDPDDFLISALPASAYLKIYDEYYRNPQLTAEIWQPLNNTTANETTRAIVLQRPLHDLWERDYFTSCLPQPQAGDDILLPLVADDYMVNDFTPVGGPFRWWQAGNNVPPVEAPDGDLIVNQDAWGDPVAPGGSAIDGDPMTPVWLDIQETASTIRQVRVAAKLLEFMEQLNRSSVRYRDMIKGFFDRDPLAGTVDRPVWIGGYVGKVIISEVLSTADTEGSALANYAGQALSMRTSKKMRYHCQEHGFIIGLIVFKPRTSYMNGMPKFFTRQAPLDYAFSQFNNIGDQAVTIGEVCWQWDANFAPENNSEFGYIPRFSEYRYLNDITSGQMRTTWTNFHLARIFTQGAGPFLNTAFVECRPRTTDVFQVAEGEDEIFCQVYHDMTVIRSLQQQAIPRL